MLDARVDKNDSSFPNNGLSLNVFVLCSTCQCLRNGINAFCTGNFR